MKAILIMATVATLISPARVDVTPKASGRVAAVHVQAGDVVRPGQVLAVLETDHLLPELHRVEAEFSRLRNIEKDLASSPGPKFDAAVKARRAAWGETAKVRRQFFDAVVRAPFRGVVEARRIEVGQRVTTNDVAFVVVQTHPLKARFEDPSAKVYAGQKVAATVGRETFPGRIAVVGLKTIEVDIINLDGRLRPGMTASVKIDSGN